MKPETLSRRAALTRTGLVLGAAVAGSYAKPAANAAESVSARPGAQFVYCLNTGTIRGQNLGIVKEIEVAAKAGFQAIEPWIQHLDKYAKDGGSLKDLKQRIADAGITVESAIGFAEWLVDDDARRARGLERAKNDMDLVAQIGGKRIAAPPAGATSPPVLELAKAAERYRALLELGDQMGVVPELELWGGSKNLSRLGQCAHVIVESGHPKACLALDVYHIYKGGSDFTGLRLFSGDAIPVFHLNDYPADPPRDKINDAARVMPGDGIAPLTQILRDLQAMGGRKVLSVELFSRKYWEADALEVAKLGLEKMKTAVQKAQS